MQDVGLISPDSIEHATELAAQYGSEACYYAGGQDLLYRLKRRLTGSPRYLIDLKHIEGLSQVQIEADGALRIGALTPLYCLAESEAVQRHAPALAAAASSIASPQIRNTGTIGGNLCQDVWCWYLLEDRSCHLNGGRTCPAAVGELTTYHAAVAQKHCVAVHPSDLAPALLALDASVLVAGPAGSRSLRVDELLPGLLGRRGDYRVNALQPGEIVTEVFVPSAPQGQRQAFLKHRYRQSWDFSVASAAASVVLEGRVCRSACIVLGGVALRPWRAAAAETQLMGHALDRTACAEAAEQALSGSRLLPRAGYKAAVAREVTRGVLESLLEAEPAYPAALRETPELSSSSSSTTFRT